MHANHIRPLAVVAVLACSALAASCGGVPCRSLPQAQALIAERTATTPDGRPHLQVLLPHHRLNLLLADAIRSGGAPSVEMPNPLRLLPLPRLALTVDRIRIVSVADGKLGFAVGLRATAGKERLLSMTLEIEATPHVVNDGNRAAVELRFAGDAVRRVRPVLGDRAREGLAAALSAVLPKSVTSRVPKVMISGAVGQLLSYFVDEGFGLVRESLLSRIGEVTSMRISLPEAPIDRIETRTVSGPQGALVVDVFTSLAVAKGLAALPSGSPVFGNARVRVSGDAVAALANWAIANGQLPKEYDEDLKPSPGGAYTPVYRWRGGKRPLQIFVFRGSSPCSVIHVGAKARAEVEQGKITVVVDDGAIEKVEGNAAVRFGVWVKDLVSGALGRTEEFVSKTEMVVRNQTVVGELVEADLTANELMLTVELSLGRRTAAR